MKPDPIQKILPTIPKEGDQESESGITEQDRIDEAMAESFPASDPPSWNAGIKHDEDDLTEDTSK